MHSVNDWTYLLVRHCCFVEQPAKKSVSTSNSDENSHKKSHFKLIPYLEAVYALDLAQHTQYASNLIVPSTKNAL